MRIRVLRSFAVGVLVIASLGSPAAAQSTPRPEPPDLKNAERRALAGMMLRALEATYAGDLAALAAIATPDAITALKATDWRAGLVAGGDVRYLGELSTGAIQEMEPVYAAEGVVKESLEVRIEAAPGARLVDATGRVVEVSTGAAWWALAVTFERDAVGAPWRIIAFGPPTDLELRFTPMPEARPCPWDPATRRRAPGDPFLLGPWCDANGQGRVVLDGDDVPRDQGSAISVFAGASHCGWEDLRFLAVGWPVGSVIDPWTAGRYVRDPAGELTDGGFRADAELPDDAVSTGITNGRATIWTSDSIGRRAIFLAVDGRVERWPRTWAGCA
jgi:hypothetical protein